MQIDHLSALGLTEPLLEAWRARGIETLTAIQQRALGDDSLLNGGNALIVAPTSAGKTFISEVLAIRQALRWKRTLYVVPYKAIAEEKFRYFNELYGPLGISVAVSSGDRDEYDDDIRSGRYLLTVVVTEKLSQLVVQSPGILAECSLVVLDEIQLIRDATRGSTVELLLTRLLLGADSPQLIGLSGTVGELGEFPEWMRAAVIREPERPVPLAEHVLTDAGRILSYDPNSNSFNLKNRVPDQGVEPLEALVRQLVGNGKQVLVFRAQVDQTIDSAQRLAQVLPRSDLQPALLASLSALDETEVRARLFRYMPHGIAFHNAGLSLEERTLVEDAFRSGSTRVLVTTTTLAMGVNLPADAVVIPDAYRWDPARRAPTPIAVGEYLNCAGRAGRLGQVMTGESYLILSESQVQEGFARRYIGADPEPIESALPKARLVDHVLTAVGSGFVSSELDLQTLFEASFGGSTYYRQEGLAAFREGMAASIAQLQHSGFVATHEGGRLELTSLGEVAARSGISVATAVQVVAFLVRAGETFSDSDWLFEVSSSAECDGLRPWATPADRQRPFVLAQRVRQLGAAGRAGLALEEALNSPFAPNESARTGLKRLALLLRWRAAEADGQLSRDYAGIGHIRTFAETVSWITQSAAELATAMGMSPDVRTRLNALAAECHFGVPLPAVPFARLRVRGLSRQKCAALANLVDQPELLLDIDPEEARRILELPLLLQVQEAVLNRVAGRLLREQHGLLMRAREAAVAESLVRDVYEGQGTEFERAIERLLNAPGLEFTATRIERQRRGEADLHIPHPSGGSIVVSASASQDGLRPITWDKAREVLGAVGVQTPIRNFIVIAKPGFHSLAIENATAIGQEEERRLLLLTVTDLVEACVSVLEGRAERAELLTFLADAQGHAATFPRDR